MTRRFSTGFPDLDRFLGGLRPGDTVLLVHSSGKAISPLWSGFIESAGNEGIPLAYLDSDGSREYQLTGTNLKRIRTSRQKSLDSPAGAKTWLRQHLKGVAKGSILLLDDLASLAADRGGPKPVLNLFAAASGWAEATGGMVIASAEKSGFGPPEVATLKDTASVCFEVIHSEGSLLLLPLHLKGRYPEGPPAPFGFKLSGKASAGRRALLPVNDFESPHGEKIRSAIREQESAAETLFDGPLNGTSFGMLVADLHGSFIAANERFRRICGIDDDAPITPSSLFALAAARERRPLLRFVSRLRKGADAAIDVALAGEGRRRRAHVRAHRLDAGLTLFQVEPGSSGPALDGFTAGSLARIPSGTIDRKRFLTLNAAMCRLLGLTARDASAPTLVAALSSRSVKTLREAMDAIDAGDSVPPFEGALRPGEGGERAVRFSLDPEGSAEGSYRLTAEDVGEYVRKVAELEGHHRRFSSLSEHLSRPVALLDGVRFVYANPAFVRAVNPPEAPGAPPATAVTRPSVDLLLPEDARATFNAAYATFLASRQTERTFEVPITRGTAPDLSALLIVRKLQGVPGIHQLLELEDVTERRREAARLAGLHVGVERVASILEAATATPDHHRLVQTALDRSLEILGWSGGAVYLHDSQNSTFRISLQKHLPKKLVEQLGELPSGEGIGGFLAKTLESHVVSLDKYPSYLPFGQVFRGAGLKRISLVPLVHKDDPIGFILGVSSSAVTAGESSLETLTTLGRQLGNALANARNFQAVRESEGRLHTVVDSLAGIVYTAGPDGQILTIDPSVSAVLGYGPRDFARNRALFLSLIHEADKKIYLERVTDGASLGDGFVREYRMRPKARAAFRWMRDNVSVTRDAQGQVSGFTGILADVTADREKMESVMHEHTILRTVQDVLPEGIAVFDAEGGCVDWNPVMERLTGMTRAAAVGKKAGAILPLPDSVVREGFPGTPGVRETFRVGLVAPVGDPSSWYEAFLVPVPGRGDTGPGFLVRYTDVTARQAELDTLLQSEKILLNVINAMDDVMMITDLNGRVVEVNQAFLKVMRYPRNAAVGQEFPYPWLVEQDMSRFLLWISRIRERQWLHDFDVTWTSRTGEEFQMSLNTTLIRNSLGEPVAMLNIARDITERVRLGRDVEARTGQLEMINRIVTLANEGADFDQVFRCAADEIVRLMPAHAVFTVGAEGERSAWTRTATFDGEGLSPFEAAAFLAEQIGDDREATREMIVGDTASARDETDGRAPGSATRLRSAIVLPLGAAGTPGAFLVVACREPHAFGEEQAERLRPVASQLGMIAARLAGERELRDRAAQLISLQEISAFIANTFDIAAVLRMALPLLRDVLGARGLIVYLTNPVDGELVLAHQEGFDPESQAEVARLHPERSITGDVVKRRIPEYVAAKVAEDRRISPENRRYLVRNSVEAMAIVPIISREDVLGALDVFYSTPHGFPDRERQLLTLAGNQIGAAIVNVRLYEELRAQVGRLSALFDLGRSLTALLDTGEICRAAFDQIRRVVPCERVTIALQAAEETAPLQVFRATRDGAEYRIEDGTSAREGGASAALPEVIRGGAVRIVDAGTTAVVPMAADDAVIGAIEVARGDGLPIDEAQVRLLESFGSLAALAVRKARLHEETLSTTEKVERRNRELDDFTYVVSHDLKEPLISIEGFSRILQADYSGVIGAEGREYLDSLVGAATRMKGLIDDLLMLSRVSRPTESFTDVDLAAVLDEVRTDMEFLIRKKHVDLRIAPGLPRVRGNATQLTILFRNLLGNAVKFNDKPAPVVEVGFQNAGNNSYLFRVQDNGIGIEPEFFEKIFVIFQRLHRREEFEGSGAGLAIVRKIIEIHQGTIRVESVKGEGATFLFTLPAA